MNIGRLAPADWGSVSCNNGLLTSAGEALEPDSAALLTDDQADHLAGLLTQAAEQAKTLASMLEDAADDADGLAAVLTDDRIDDRLEERS